MYQIIHVSVRPMINPSRSLYRFTGTREVQGGGGEIPHHAEGGEVIDFALLYSIESIKLTEQDHQINK